MNVRPHSVRERGFTFPELALGLLVLVVVAAFMVNHLTINLHAVTNERERVFAFGKAQGILAEIQSSVERGDLGPQNELDALDDGIVAKPTLTITRDENGDLVLPDHVLSGNFQRDGQWVWSRRIIVQPFPGVDNRNVRYVTVRVYQKDFSGRELEVADVSGVVNAPGNAFPTTQVFDLYLLAIENIPGWWVFMDSIRPFVESTITDLETRNPGLEVRTHWITKASFGRNAGYRPWINDDADSLATIPDVYHYPGRMPAGNASTYYYVPANIKGRIARDGVETGGYDQEFNPHPYALADWFNHAMRYPDELRLHEARVRAVKAREDLIAAARAAGTAAPPPLDDMSKEPTLRLLLEDLNTNPDKYRNALIVNLHGELLPMPALRNYSDAAKDPEALREVRVVTHPEQLRTLRDPAGTATEDARFRVYAYNTRTAGYTGPPVMPFPIAVEVVGVDMTNPATAQPDLLPAARLQNLRGGVRVGTTSDYFPFANAKVQGDPSLLPSEMYYSAVFEPPAPDGSAPGFTRILLFNTPVVAPQEADDAGGTLRGLASNERSQLYMMAYVPSPCEAARDFSRDLHAPVAGVGGNAPKNTARWRFSVPAAAFPQRWFVGTDGSRFTPVDDLTLEVRTRIWTGPGAATSGTMWPPELRNAPDNLSTTYTWWADSREDVPVTERSQFQGDPRHCPYRDLQNTDPDFANGYNRYFDALNNGGEDARPTFPGLLPAYLANRWRGRTSFDTPRLLELLREGLVKSRCVYTTLTGFSYYYLGIGADIGYDAANGYPNSIPIDLTPYGSPGSDGFVNTITGSRTFVRGSGSTYWWGMPWLGELYPDSAYASQWLALDGNGNMRGNLAAGTGNGQFRQGGMDAVYSGSAQTAFGTAMQPSQQLLREEGCTSLFNIGSAGSTFHHQYADGTTGSLTTTGQEIADNYNFNMPTTAPISRPFGVATGGTGGVGNEFDQEPYRSERYVGSLLRAYYNHPNNNIGSGVVQLRDTGNTAAAFVVVNGLDRTVESGSNFIAKYSMLSLVHSYFEAGAANVAHRILQPPRVEILAPTDVTELVEPVQIDIVVSTSWTRWDGFPYTETGAFGEDESELDYVVMYSNDGGSIWRYVLDNTLATPGTRPTDARYLFADSGPGNETWTWSVPGNTFPQGSYQLRVDCFRRGAPIHFSYHRTRLFVQR